MKTVPPRTHTPRNLLAVGIVMLTTACTTVGPDYVRPVFDAPVRYKEAVSGEMHDHYFAPEGGRWWEIYRDPILNALVEQVTINNQSLAAADARMRQAQDLVRVASGARLPTVSAGTFKAGRQNDLDFGLVVSWELDLWGKIRRDIEAHKASAQASANDLAAATLSMQTQVVQAYFSVREADAVVDLLREALDVDTQWTRMVHARHAIGLASNTDLASALAQQSGVQMQLANSQTSRAQFEHALAVLTGTTPADFTLAPAPFNVTVPEIPTGLPATLLDRRPDIAASERRMAAATARVGVSKAETLPSINLAAGIGILKGPRAAIDVDAPLFTGGRLEAQVDQAWDDYAESVANYRQTVLDAFREVEDSLVAANNLTEAFQSQSLAATAAQKSERDIRNQYQLGVADYPALVHASSVSLDTSRAELELRLQRLSTSVNLIKALGGGWQPESDAVP